MQYTYTQAEQNPEVVKIINRVFHDFDADQYADEHPEIYDLEKKEWQELFTAKIAPRRTNDGITLLDIGTGNGFVIKVLEEQLIAKDQVIFTNISEKMLNVVSKNFFDSSFKKSFFPCDAARIPVPDTSVDIITVNSVLHHLPDAESFLREATRILRPNGMLIVKHEPNIRFVRNAFLRQTYLFLNKIRSSRYDQTPKLISLELTIALKEEGVEFSEPITTGQIQALVDIASPTAGGGMSSTRGFDIEALVSKAMPRCTITTFHCYAYLGKINERKNWLTRIVASVFRRMFPRDGYLFDVIIEKNR